MILALTGRYSPPKVVKNDRNALAICGSKMVVDLDSEMENSRANLSEKRMVLNPWPFGNALPTESSIVLGKNLDVKSVSRGIVVENGHELDSFS